MSQYDKTTEAKAEEYALAVEWKGEDYGARKQYYADAFKAGRASAKPSLELAVRALREICRFHGQCLAPNPRWENREQDAYASGSENAFGECISIAKEAIAAIKERGDYP